MSGNIVKDIFITLSDGEKIGESRNLLKAAAGAKIEEDLNPEAKVLINQQITTVTVKTVNIYSNNK